MESFPVTFIEPKLFWTKGFFVIVGPSGSGKTTIIKTALKDPRKYIGGLPDKGATLWVFVGASHDLQRELEPELDASVFTDVRFVSERAGDCTELLAALEKSTAGDTSHCIFIDDYMSYGRKDFILIKNLLHTYKRHETLCTVVALHNLRRDKVGAVPEMVEFADRILFTKTTGNVGNVAALLAKMEVPKCVQQPLRKEFAADRGLPPEKKRYGVAVFDRTSSMIISDYRALSEGVAQRMMYCYGEWISRPTLMRTPC